MRPTTWTLAAVARGRRGSRAGEHHQHVVPHHSKPASSRPAQSLTDRFVLFAGPKRPPLLDQYKLDDLVYYGWFGWVAKPMLAVLHLFYGVVHNYGLAIILLTVLVRLCMFPLSRKQALSAQKMQELQPEIKKIQEKYKKDMEARSKAQQELFRKHNYNPLSGCLVLFIQLPIFVGLYRSLMVDVELRDAPLISEAVRWCSNLAAPDMLFNWSGWIMPELSSTAASAFSASGRTSTSCRSSPSRCSSCSRRCSCRRRPTSRRHAAEGDEVHDDLHGHLVLQGGQRPVPVLHRVEPVGPGGAEAPAQDGGRRRSGKQAPADEGPARFAALAAAPAPEAEPRRRSAATK